jgi:N-acylglucosamine 2-epimerase
MIFKSGINKNYKKEGYMLDKNNILEKYNFCKNHLLNEIMPFWEERTYDKKWGGYLTCFDRKGDITDTNKYIWFQGRQLWMFSALYNQFHEKKWLDLAAHGRKYLVEEAYAKDGRWNYQLDQKGNVTEGTISIFTDLFVLSGLAEFAIAADSDIDIDLISRAYKKIEENVYNPDFKDIYHNTWSPKYKRHSVYMITMIVAPIVGKLLGDDRTRPLIDHCLENILYLFAKDEHEALFESIGKKGEYIDESEGHIIYPGHVFESCWACIQEGRRRKDKSIVDRAVQIVDWVYKKSVDNEYGGIYSYLDATSDEPEQLDWNKETNMSWHDKNFWVNAEAIAITSIVAMEKQSKKYFDNFNSILNWCYQKFYDHEYGEWYAELYRNGSIKLADKGTKWKAAYHVPRAMLIAMNELKNNL